uniref:Ephrin RBD domain-containing protein n=1 Tax=Maylandia zebra TaxID=106582 RepID=A0A3P9CF51_9CICH
MYQSLIATCSINAVVVLPSRLTAGDLSVQLNFNDYLDIHCPHYPNEEAVVTGSRRPLGGSCASEKIQRFTPFSLGFEFLPGRHYYYSLMNPNLKFKLSPVCTEEVRRDAQHECLQPSVKEICAHNVYKPQAIEAVL